MSMLIGRNNPNVKRIEVKRADGTVAGSITITRTAKKKQKRLRYNFKEISTRIMRARTSGNARQAMTNARQKVAQLRKMQKSGVYDDKELQSAILHAEAIARVAKKRMKHLQEEEKADKQGGPCEAELEERSEELTMEEVYGKIQPELDLKAVQELMQEAMEELERLNDTTEFSEELMLAGISENMDPADLELMKKKHRADELREIMEADMKYLKALFDKLAKEKQSGSSGIGGGGYGNDNSVSLQLGGVDVPVQPQEIDAAAMAEGGIIDTTV